MTNTQYRCAECQLSCVRYLTGDNLKFVLGWVFNSKLGRIGRYCMVSERHFCGFLKTQPRFCRRHDIQHNGI
jgi:hypothetical protein